MSRLTWVLLTIGLCSTHAATDEQAITEAVKAFSGGNVQELQSWLAEDYVHVTPDGMMTKSWRIALTQESHHNAVEKLHIRVWGDLAVAAYVWRTDEEKRTSSVMQAFQKRQGGWRILATQVGGSNSAYFGPIRAAEVVTPTNPPQAEAEVRQAWASFMQFNLRTATGETAEDMDLVRKVIAEDMLYVLPNGSALTREERLTLGHRGVKQLSSDEKKGAVVVPTKHLDEQVAVFGNAAVWVSRNPAPLFNGNQAFRVWLKRPGGWQVVADHQGMSYRKMQ